MDLRSPSSAPTSYLRSHEQNDLMRQVDSLQSALAARDTEVARLRQLTDKGALQKEVQKLQNFIAELRVENQKLQEQVSSLPVLQKQIQDFEQTFEDLRTDTEQRVGETQMAHAEMGDKYRSQLGLITDLEHRLESKEMELQQARAAAQAAQEQCRQAVAHAEELTAELGRVREGSQVELLEDRLHSMQSELDQKTFDLQELQKQHSSVSTMYDELSRQHEAIKRTVRTQIDRATSGTQADLADMQTKYSEAQTALKEAQSVARKSELRLEEAQKENFALQSQLSQYEQGLGVRDVMDKLRRFKVNVSERDNTISELHNQISKQDRYIYTMLEDWRKLRKQMGLPDQLDQDEAMSSYHHKLELAKSDTAFLQQRVDSLEAERRSILEDLRKQMVHTNEAGLKFYGISPEQMNLVVQYAESLRDGTNQQPLNDKSRALASQLYDAKQESDQLRARIDQLAMERDVLQEKLRSQNHEGEEKYQAILSQLSELRSAKSDSAFPADMTRQLTDLISTIGRQQSSNRFGSMASTPKPQMTPRTPHVASQPSLTAQSTSQFDFQPSATNDSLMTRTFNFASTAPVQQPAVGSSTATLAPVPAPASNMQTNQSSASSLHESEMNAEALDGIASDHRLLAALKQLAQCERDLETAQRALSVQAQAAQQHAAMVEQLYTEHSQTVQKLTEDKTAAESRLSEANATHEKDVIALRALRDSLRAVTAPGADMELVSRVQELTDRVSLAEGDVVQLQRQCTSMESDLKLQRTARQVAEADLLEAERVARTRVSQLQRSLHEAQARLDSQGGQSPTAWVSRSDFSKLCAQHASLAQRYRALLQDHTSVSAVALKVADQRRECERLNALLIDLEARLELTETKAARFDDVCRAAEALKSTKGQHSVNLISPTSQLPNVSDVTLLQARIASLEANEAAQLARTARVSERATMAQSQLVAAEDASLAAEQRVRSLQDALMKEREVNIELKRQVEAAVPFDLASALEKRVAELEQLLASSEARLQQQRTVAGAATAQVASQHDLRQATEAEMADLRKAIVDLQSRTEETAIVGKLEAELIGAKVAARNAERRCAELKKSSAIVEETASRAEMQASERVARAERAVAESKSQLAKYRSEAAAAEFQRSTLLSVDEADHIRAANADLERRIADDREWKQRTLQELFAVRLEVDSLRLERSYRLELIEALGLQGLSGSVATSSQQAPEHALKRKVVKWEQVAREAKLSQMMMASQLEQAQAQVVFGEESVRAMERNLQRVQRQLVDSQLEGESLSPRQSKAVNRNRSDEARNAFSSHEIDSRSTPIKSRSVKSPEPASRPSLQLNPAATEALHAELAELRTDLQLAQKQIEVKEKMIADQQKALQSHAKTTAGQASKLAHPSSPSSTHSANELVSAVGAQEKARIVAAAQEQIKSLQLLLEQKNKAVASYQKLLTEQQEAFAEEKAKDQAELARLHDRMLRLGDDQHSAMKAAMAQLEQLPLTTTDVVSVDTARDQLAVKERQLALAMVDNDRLQRSADEARILCAKGDEELARARAQIADLEHRLSGAAVGSMVKTLKSQLADKDEKMRQLNEAIRKLKADLLQLANEAQLRQSQGDNAAAQRAGLLSSTDRPLNASMTLDEKSQMERKLKAAQTQLTAAQERAAVFEAQLAKAQQMCNDERVLAKKAQDALTQAKVEAQQLNDRLNRSQSEVKELRQSKTSSTDPSASSSAPPASVAAESADDKRYQKQALQLKTKVEELTAALAKAQARIDELNSLVAKSRVASEKDASEIKALKAAQAAQAEKSNQSMTATGARAIAEAHAAATVAATALHTCREEVHSLQAQITHLQAEVLSFKLKLEQSEALRVSMHKQHDPVHSEDSHQDGVPHYAQPLQPHDHSDHHHSHEAHHYQTTTESAAPKLLPSAVAVPVDLHERLMTTERELMELRFEHDNCSAAEARALRRVEDANELIASQNLTIAAYAAVGPIPAAHSVPASKAASTVNTPRALVSAAQKEKEVAIKEIAAKEKKDAKKEAELVATIDVLNSTVDKLKAEVESLKRSTTSNLKYMEVVNAHKKLKLRCAELETAADANATAHRATVDKEFERLSQSYEAISRSLSREQETSAKLRARIQELAATETELKAQAVSAARIADEARRNAEMHGARAELVASEAQTLQADLAQKSRQVESLSRAVKELSEHIAQLRRQGIVANGDGELLRELEAARQENAALRNELSAFDVNFFDEIMDLKYKHEQLQIAHAEAMQRLQSYGEA